MEKGKKELRMLPMAELRVAENDGGGSYIEGHAAVFDSWSETLGGIFPFKEIVRKGAFNESIGKDDIRALFNHDPNYVLGRNRAGTLELVEDEVGLRVRITPPDEDKWSTENGMDTREIRKVQLFDVSPVTFPAYTATDVGVRAMEEYNGYKAEQRSKAEAAEKTAEKAKQQAKLKGLQTKFKNY